MYNPKTNTCIRCGQKFPAARSDQMYCVKSCRLKNYASQKRVIKCIECGYKNNCKQGKNFKGKTRPRNCPNPN